MLCGVASILSGVGCIGNNSPELLPVDPQQTFVNNRLDIEVWAHDPDGDAMRFDFELPGRDLGDRARMASLGDHGLFSWTPNASDVGQHQIDFIVTDGQDEDREPVQITVHPATDPDTAPRFRRPLGQGTVLDLTENACIDIEVEVEDPDSAEVEIRQEPVLANAELATTGPLTATLSWCPDAQQQKEPVHRLHLWADDRDNPPVEKIYEIMLQQDLPRVVVTELMIDPAAVADKDGEWIELHNASAATVNLEGWTIQDQPGAGQDLHVIEGELQLPPSGYLVLARNADPALNGGVNAAYVYGSSIQLANTADEIFLLDAEGRLIDSVAYLSSWPRPTGSAISLRDPAQDNNIADSWCTEDQPWAGGAGDNGTPGSPPGCP